MISSNRRARARSESCLESLIPAGTDPAIQNDRAATTGPARGPRPASSTPATSRMPQSASLVSISRKPSAGA